MLKRLMKDRAGAVAIWVGVSAPVLMAMSGVALEASQWAVVKSQLQVAADSAALAGVHVYGSTLDGLIAAGAAADLAEANGVEGTPGRTWSSATKQLTDNHIMVQVGPGVSSTANASVSVTVSRTIGNSFSALLGGPASQTISVTAVADSIPLAGGGQPCVLALNTTGNAIDMSGSNRVTGTNCTLRSNANVRVDGSNTINAAIYAAGTIGTSGSNRLTGGTYAHAGTIADPYATYMPLQTALAGLHAGSGSAYNFSGSGTITLQPGTYSSLHLSGSNTVTLNPGLYVVNGNVVLDGSSRITGSGITIIASGTITFSGSNQLNLTAPTAGSTSGGVAGILLASTSTGGSVVTGSSNLPLTGGVYVPNGSLTFTGSSAVNGCTEVIAKNVTIDGSGTLEANCAAYGLPEFGSLPATYTSRLVL